MLGLYLIVILVLALFGGGSSITTKVRRLFQTMQDGILILDVDTGQIKDVNPGWSRC
jgi:hypothetical protein